MSKSKERLALEIERRAEERRKSKNRESQRTFAMMLLNETLGSVTIDEDTGQIRDDNWISLGYRGKKRR